MSTLPQRETAIDADREAWVAEYLSEHPDFFGRHLALLARLKLPHATGGAVSLLERQLQLLREENRDQVQRLDQLIAVARENERLTEQVHRLALSLMAIDDMAGLASLLPARIAADFGLDAVCVTLFDVPVHTAHPALRVIARQHADAATLATLAQGRKPLCGRFTAAQYAALFADAAGPLGSAAVIPLCAATGSETLAGVLALGSASPEQFHSGLGSLFLYRLGEVVAAALLRHLLR